MIKPGFCCAALIVLAACGSDSAPSEPPKTQSPPGPFAGSVTIDQLHGFLGKILFDVRDQTTFTATVRDATGVILEGHHVTWLSSAPDIATVDSTGLVTAIAPGDATITAVSDRKSDARDIEVRALNLTAFQLTVLVTDTAGTPMPGISVIEEYYGARPAACLSCNIPWGNYVAGMTNSSGSYTGSFVASPETMNGWSGFPHTYGYVIVKQAGYETDRRWAAGTATTFTQTIVLRALRQINAGDSLSLTIASTDPVFQDLDTEPALEPGVMCRTFRVLAATDGVLTVNAVPVEPGAAVYVELDRPDESGWLNSGVGSVSNPVHAGEVVAVRVFTFIKAGDPARAFVVHTAVR